MRLRLATALVATFGLFGGLAHAQGTAPGFAVNRFEPAEKGSHWFANESLDLRGHLRPAVSVTGEFSYRSLLLYQPDGDIRASVVRNQFVFHPGASVVLVDRLRLAFNLPIQAGADGHTGTVTQGGVTTTFLAPPDSGGIGDLRLAADARVYGQYGDPVTIAAGLQAWLPTGRQRQWIGDGEVRLRPRVMVAGDVGMFAYAGQLAVTWRSRDEIVGPGSIGSELNLTAAAGAKLLDRNLVVGPELWASSTFGDFFGKKTTPVEAALGAHYLAWNEVRFGAGAGTGLTRAFGSPVVRYMASIEWVPGATK
jgi:OmpA-OmpF porin, OOP family